MHLPSVPYENGEAYKAVLFISFWCLGGLSQWTHPVVHPACAFHKKNSMLRWDGKLCGGEGEVKQFCVFSFTYSMSATLSTRYNLQWLCQHKFTNISPTIILPTGHFFFFQPVLAEELTQIEIWWCNCTKENPASTARTNYSNLRPGCCPHDEALCRHMD